jgi:hypothetical protein
MSEHGKQASQAERILFVGGVALMLVGAAPLVVTVLLAQAGVLTDPYPFPIGYGIAFYLSSGLSLVTLAVALAFAVRRMRKAIRR